ncbi:prepilin-type N-terminal cleavage/methylation domain-containing protein [Candidatus Nomurabacteria bacterium]|nr:prepilin-type N-terminal cleavage/methylation domain-containing protein [Candidatus Nomurabacteria bacterium]
MNISSLTKIKFNFHKGFTIIETLVAISIFSISILSLMVILSNGISDTNYAKQKMTAEYLAQEGVEYVRNIRDSFALTSNTSGWNDFKNILVNCDVAVSLTGCYLNDRGDIYLYNNGITSVLVPACVNNICPMLYDENSGKYGYVSGRDSGFVRTIKVDGLSNSLNFNNEIKIISTVYWKQGSGQKEISFSENLFNWIQ